MAKATTTRIPAPPPPPTPPAPAVTTLPDPPTPPDETQGTTSEPITTPPPPPPAPEPPAPTSAVAGSGSQAPDRDGDGTSGGSLPDDPKKRADRISQIGYEDGKHGHALKAKPREWTDSEYSRYTASHSRGVAQADANKLSSLERVERIERHLNLPVPERETN